MQKFQRLEIKEARFFFFLGCVGFGFLGFRILGLGFGM